MNVELAVYFVYGAGMFFTPSNTCSQASQTCCDIFPIESNVFFSLIREIICINGNYFGWLNWAFVRLTVIGRVFLALSEKILQLLQTLVSADIPTPI